MLKKSFLTATLLVVSLVLSAQEVSRIHPRETIKYYTYWYEKNKFVKEQVQLPDEWGGFLFYKLGEAGGPLESYDSLKKVMEAATDLFYGEYNRFLFFAVVKDLENDALKIVQHYDSLTPEHPGPIIGIIRKRGRSDDNYVFSDKGIGLIFIKESDMKLFKDSVPRSKSSILDLGAKIVTVNKTNEATFYFTIMDCARDAKKSREQN